MRLPTKPWHTPTSTPILPIFLASCIAVATTCLDVFSPRTTSSRRITLAGEKKCRPMHPLRTLGGGGDLVDVQIRSVGGEDGALLDDPVELAEHILLHVHVFEHGFDDQVAVSELFQLERAGQQAHALLDVFGLELAALRGGLVVLADDAQAALQRFLFGFDDGDRNAGVGEVHRDAAAHGAGADDADLRDRQRRCVGRHIRNLPHFALGEEHVALRGRLHAAHRLLEQRALDLHAFVERQIHRSFNGADVVFGSEEAAELASVGFAEVGEEFRLAPRGFDLVIQVAHLLERALLGDDLLRKGDRAGAQRPSGTISSIRPAAFAVFASMCAPDVTISSAFSGPTMRGRRCVPPAPGNKPR